MNTTLSDSSRKPLFPRGPGLGLKFIFLAALSVGLLITDGRGTDLAPVRAWTAWMLSPLLWVASLPQGLSALGDHFSARESLLAENRALKQRQLELDARLLRMAALEAENERLRALLASSSALADRVLIADVMSASQDPYRRQFLLDRGARDGVFRGQAVVDADGVMGQIVQVNPTNAVALLITDPDHGIPVQVNRTGLQTIALGRGDGEGLTLPYLPSNADLKVGDLLVTSGLGGRFPTGYPVGKIYRLRHDGDTFMEALAHPTAHLHEDHQALLVWSARSELPDTDALPALPIDLGPRPTPKRAKKAADAVTPGSRGKPASGKPEAPSKAAGKAAETRPRKAPAPEAARHAPR